MNNKYLLQIKKDSSQEIKPHNISILIEKYNVINYYMSLELLPISKIIKIIGLYCCSFDDFNNNIKEVYKYKFLNKINGDIFDNNSYQIIGEEFVNPIVILTDNQAFRVQPILWSGLTRIYINNKLNKIFPKDILITNCSINGENSVVCEWVYNLL
jgi:hypothetical protein